MRQEGEVYALNLQLPRTDTGADRERLTGKFVIRTVRVNPAFGLEDVRIVPEALVVGQGPRGNIELGLDR